MSHPAGHITCLGVFPWETGLDLSNNFPAHLNNENDILKAKVEVVERVFDSYLENALEMGAFLVLNHPAQWRENIRGLVGLDTLKLLHSIEVYNGNRLKKGNAEAYTGDIYDFCLSNGFKIWASASPDCHTWDISAFDSPFNGYAVVFSEELSSTAILSSLREGRFYASTGLEVDKIKITGKILEVCSPGCKRISFIGGNGKLLAEVNGPAACYEFSGTEKYVRVELESDSQHNPNNANFPAKAWLQLVWIE